MKVYFRLVKGKGFYDRIIRWYSRSDYTHAEFAWPLDSKNPEQWLGAQPKGGVKIRPKNYLPWNYDLFCVDISPEQYRGLQRYVLSQLGKPYDWKAILNMGVFQHDVTSPKRWFCSELVFGALGYVGVYLLRAPLSERDRITPRDLGVSVRGVFIRRRANNFDSSKDQ